MPPAPYSPVFELTRGETIESIHFGAIAIVDVEGRLVAKHGDPSAVTFLRSSAKPFQALPFIEKGGAAAFELSAAEIALICASHSGTDEHVATVRSIQEKSGVREADLMCGVHPPLDEATAEALRQRGEEPTPNRHNCSGKHTGMLAYARMEGWSTADYIDPDHPVQESILQTFAEMCATYASVRLSPEQVALGVDGCSAPNFAVPLRNAALAYARLCDPRGLSRARAAACRTITNAMSSHPEMVAGPGRFDTRLMEVGAGRIVAKGGAEGYQALGLLPGALGPGSPGVGIAMKISDGDLKGRVRPGVSLEVLRQLGALSPAQVQALADFGPVSPVRNWRGLVVGQARPRLDLRSDGVA
ncbi:MAG: asparaginase [Anaerolineales bacterium]|jgi:L-asparaginase II